MGKIGQLTLANKGSRSVSLPHGFNSSPSAALLNKSEWLAGVLFTPLSPSPTSPSSSFSLPYSITKDADPHGWLGTCAGVNLNPGAMVTGHGAAGQGSVSAWVLSWGTKKKKKSKRKQMEAGVISPLPTHFCYGLHLFSLSAPLPQRLFNQCPQNPLGGFEVEECLKCVSSSTRHHITRPVHGTMRPVSPKHSAQLVSVSCLAAALLLREHVTSNKQEEAAEWGDRGKTGTTINQIFCGAENRTEPCVWDKLHP